MKAYRKDENRVDVLDKIECDRCHQVISSKDNYDIQEVFSIDIHCGYGSKTWGDLHRVECDLCEQCIYELIKDFARVTRYAQERIVVSQT